MTKERHEAKSKLKTKLSEMIDAYYEEFEESSKEPDFDINRIEKLMLKQRAQTHELLLAANEELSRSVNEADKKTVPIAPSQWIEQKSVSNSE